MKKILFCISAASALAVSPVINTINIQKINKINQGNEDSWTKQNQLDSNIISKLSENKNYLGLYSFIKNKNGINSNNNLAMTNNLVSYNTYYGQLNYSDILFNGKITADLSPINGVVGNDQYASIIKQGFSIDSSTNQVICNQSKIKWGLLPIDIQNAKNDIIDMSLEEINDNPLSIIPFSPLNPASKVKVSKDGISSNFFWTTLYLSENTLKKIEGIVGKEDTPLEIIASIINVISLVVDTGPFAPIVAALAGLAFIYLEVFRAIDHDFHNGIVANLIFNTIIVGAWAQ